jgi:PII-like signaling protein
MRGTFLKFYVHENRRHHSILLYEWLLEKAKHFGIHGGSAFRSIAGFGRLGVIHEEHFFELAGALTVEVAFAVSDAEANRLLDLVRAENLALFYTKMPVEYGVVNGSIEQPIG